MSPAIDWAAALDRAIVLRTDHTDDRAWRAIVAALDARPGGAPDDEPPRFVVDDPAWAGADRDGVLSAVGAAPEGHLPAVVFLADAIAMREPHALLAVSTLTRADCEDDDEYEDLMSAGREFRVLADSVDDVHGNLVIANMDFLEFAESARADPAGWYRTADDEDGSPRPAPRSLPDGPRCDGARLRRGEILRDGAITSPDGRYALICGDDGVVLRGPADGVFVALGHIAGPVIELTDDGLLRTYRPGGAAFALIPDFDVHGRRRRRWPADERGRPAPAVGAHALLVRDDGDIDLVDETDVTQYSFGTAHHLRLLGELRAMAVTRPRDG